MEAEATGFVPGRALDVGSGEGGADAIWLAAHGWQVTGLDFSTLALERAAAHAEVAGVSERTAWRHADVRVFDPGPERWDLVSAHYMHQPDGAMVELTRRPADAVGPGGTLLVVGHHPRTASPGCGTAGSASCTPRRTCSPALDHDAWEVQVTDVRPRTATATTASR